MKKLYTIGVAAILFASCKPSADVTTPSTAGEAVFTNYLAVGCSYSAGYADKSLTVSGQLNSYPQRLFEQFETIEDGFGANGPFIQPLVTGDNGYPEPKLVLGTSSYCDGTVSLAPVATTLPLDSNGSWRYINPINNAQINNISIPRIRVADYLVSGYAGLNKYAQRFYYNPAQRPLDELYSRVYNLGPTFFTVWLGVTDVLGYAVAGGQGDGTGNAVPVTLNIYNTSDITPTSVFTSAYDSILKAVSSTSAKGALINIPDVSALPYFNTVPANGLYIDRQSYADTLQALYSTLSFDKVFLQGYNYYIIKDNDDQTRQAVPGELILMTVPRDSIKCAGWGSTKPIPKEYVLTTDELQNIRNTIKSFNAYIEQECKLRKLAYVDINSFMKTLSTGMAYNGINYSTEYISGGAFSLDGIHLNARGNALVANHIIKAINAYYKSTIPQTDANKYPGIKFP
jgi:hypothetical protein